MNDNNVASKVVRKKSKKDQIDKSLFPSGSFRNDKLDGENIIDYLRRVWGDHIAARRVTRIVLEAVDPSAYWGLYNYLREGKRVGKRELPKDLYLPTEEESNTEQLKGNWTAGPDRARLGRVVEWRLRNGKYVPF